MRVLRISDFSCIENATVNFAKLTVIIGPQASGKSIISKLSYFFQDFIEGYFRYVEDSKNVSEFKSEIRDQFIEWFPVAAWGSRKFTITYEAGDFWIRVTRVKYAENIQENVRIRISSSFEEHYRSAYNTVIELGKKEAQVESPSSPVRQLELNFEARRLFRGRAIEKLGSDYISYQLFIPAGRSFFTNLGRAVAVFEHSTILDPVTRRFGRVFSSMRDNRYAQPRARIKNNIFRDLSKNVLQTVFGGRIKIERDKEYFETEDGRQIPFSALSSGQQELLPIWLLFDTFLVPSSTKQLIYIEEPEAHLFPTAQSIIIQALTTVVSSDQLNTELVITTHSPYVIAKINNLMKAKSIFMRLDEKSRLRLETSMAASSLLDSKDVSAYCIRNGNVYSIMEEDGLIDAEYLDEVSDTMSDEFSMLLELEDSL